MNNILLGEKRDAQDIEKALYSAGMGELAGGMSIGYNSRVGESGSSFSGGQNQRIAIARALVKRPEVLLLDEATSFLDSDAEDDILKNIKKLYPDVTVIFVTHRPIESKYADEVLIIDGGKASRQEGVFKTTGDI